MNKITEEKININFVNFVKILKKYNLYTDKFSEDDDFNKKLKTAPSHTQEESGGAYDGGLIEHILLVTNYAKKLNETILPKTELIDNNSLMKVCFLHQIAKAEQYTPNTVDWDIKRGNFYKFTEDLPALKTGEISAYICNKYGIELNIIEYEAILSIDKQDDIQTKLHGSTLSFILKIANEFANAERKKNFTNNK